MGSAEEKLKVAVALILGFVLGYKAKEWRILWLKRRRDRLADKLREAQAELDVLSKRCDPKIGNSSGSRYGNSFGFPY